MALWAAGTAPAGATAAPPELASARFTYSPAAGLGHDPEVTRRDPSDVIKVGPAYYVWYTKTTRGHSGYDATVWYATSTDGRSWTERGEALARGRPGAWDEASVFTPNILVAGRRYLLFYTAIPAHKVLDTTPTAIGVAVADSPDGPWRRYPGNPVLRPSLDPADFDSFRVDDACLITRDGRYWLFYKGRQRGRSPAETKMGVAIATAPTGPYIKSRHNPVVDSGHEVLVWPHREGVAALITWAGPQRNTLQYAPDGLHFTRVSQVEHVPHAPGAYRPDAFISSPFGLGIRWGIAMAPRPPPPHVRYDSNLAVEKPSEADAHAPR